MRPRLVLAAAGLATALASEAAAAPPPSDAPSTPAGTASKDPASTGSTELAGQGQFGQVAKEDEAAGDATEWDLSFGALFSTGNARSNAITGGSTFRLRRSRHQVYASFLGNYGRAATSPDAEPVDTVGNLQGRVRYDLFLNGEKVDEAKAQRVTTDLVNKNRDIQAVIAGDKGIAYGDVMHIVDLVKSLGVTKFAMATDGT